jgi:ribonucleoside-triphosphate reductase
MLVPREPFSLDSTFLDKYRGRDPRWSGLGELVYYRTYSNPLPEGGTEDFWQTCQRVIEGMYQIQKGHCKRLGLPWSDAKAQGSAQEAFERMFAFKWLPPGRGLARMGTDHLFKFGGASLFNCGAYTTANIGNRNIPNAFSRPWTWTLIMSMLGVGVGIDTRGAGTVSIINPTRTDEPYVIPDSREGWSDYLQRVLESYVDYNVSLPNNVDYSLIRPLGAPIKGFGGTASGPEALQKISERIHTLMRMYMGKPVDSRFIVDLTNSIGECVVAGGTRRSSQILFSTVDDEQFMRLKDWSNPESTQWPRWASNNSVFVDVDSDFSKAAALTANNGEPGYLFLENARKYGRMSDPPDYRDTKIVHTNPCGEISLMSAELCNLVETFPHNCDSYEDYERTLKFAYLYSKTVTLVPTHDEETNAVMLRNRRIGCSQSGIQDSIAKIGLREHLKWSDQGYKYIQKLDGIYSDWLCIPRSIKTTTVKPSGSISKVASCREGIHHEKSEYILQSIRIHNSSPLIKPLRDANYRIEEAINEPNTVVVYFPIHSPKQRPAETITMWEQIELGALMQYYWADNLVSQTVDFDKTTEGPYIQQVLEMYAHRIKGTSFLPRNDHGYAQAPKTPITKEEYDAYVATLKPYSLRGLQGHDTEERYCSNGVCEIPINADQAAE